MQKPSNRFEIYLQTKILPEDFPVTHQKYEQKTHLKSKLHYHNCLEIGFCESGSGLEMVSNQYYAFSAGSVSILPAGCVHDAHIVTQKSESVQSVWKFIFADTEALGLSQTDFGGFLTKDERFSALFSMLYDELAQKPEGYREQAKTLLSALLMLAKRNAQQKDIRETAVLPPELAVVLEYINKNYHQTITIETLCALAKQSESSFCREFKSYCGTSPMHYINTLRLAMAKNMLKSTAKSIMEIASSVGFRSLSSFNRLFKQQYGIAPRQMRKNDPFSS